MQYPKVEVGCMLVGDYVDQAVPHNPHGVYGGEVARPQVVGDFVDVWAPNELKEFTVLMKDGRVVTVRGQALKHSAHSIPGEDVYGIVIGSGADEAIIALFKSSDVSGIFHGDVRVDRNCA
jgi:hypothetical protein